MTQTTLNKKQNDTEPPKSNALSLVPLALFLLLFIGTGIALTQNGTQHAFYQLSAAVAILPAIIFSMCIGKEKLEQKITLFLGGVGHVNIVTMCMIYLLAGGFASVAKAIGGVDATVQMGLAFLPAQFVLPGLFLISSFVATAMGTSMGTIAAIAPIAAGIATNTGMSSAMLTGAVVGGAMFGDNLSMISDTTIAATRTQGCEMSDKFRMNIRIAIPAAFTTLLLFTFFGESVDTAQNAEWDFVKVMPYLFILGLAVAGVNVFVVLTIGILLCGGVGLYAVDAYTLLQFSKDIYAGFAGMNEILVLSMLIGGLGELIRHQGGLQWLLDVINRLSKKMTKGNRQRSGEFSIAGLAALADVCTANNTVAIILSSRLAKEIAEEHGVSAKRSASILDIFSCIVQGLIPYAAQVLLAGSIAGISPLQVSTYNWYCIVLFFVSMAAIMKGWPKTDEKSPLS